MIKKLFFICLLLSGTAGFAQVDFGINAGFNNSTVKNSTQGRSESADASGYFVGVLSQFSLTESFQLEGAVNYVNAEDSNFLQIPVLLKYYVGSSAFNIQAGPQASIILDEVYGPVSKFGLDLALGAGYDINTDFFVFARYSFEVTNRTSEGFQVYSPDVMTEQTIEAETRYNALNIGLGYRF